MLGLHFIQEIQDIGVMIDVTHDIAIGIEAILYCCGLSYGLFLFFSCYLEKFDSIVGLPSQEVFLDVDVTTEP